MQRTVIAVFVGLVIAGALAIIVALFVLRADPRAAGLTKIVAQKKAVFDMRLAKWEKSGVPNSRQECTDALISQDLLAEAASEYLTALERLEQVTGPDAKNSGLLEYLKFIKSSNAEAMAALEEARTNYDRLDGGDERARRYVEINKAKIGNLRASQSAHRPLEP